MKEVIPNACFAPRLSFSPLSDNQVPVHFVSRFSVLAPGHFHLLCKSCLDLTGKNATPLICHSEMASSIPWLTSPVHLDRAANLDQLLPCPVKGGGAEQQF